MLNRVRSLTFVSVSYWISDIISHSVQGHRTIKTIHNGIDLHLFKPLLSHSLNGPFKILGVAAVWNSRKGLDDFIKLREFLPRVYEIILVGLSQKQISILPHGIIGITRTTNIQELVQLYSDSDVFVNPTYSDNFPTTNIEALACGTPVITYKTGGSPEAVDENTGIIVPQGDVKALSEAIMNLKERPLSSEACRKRAETYFDKDKCFYKYIELYNELLKK